MKHVVHWCPPMMATSPGHPPHAAPLSPPNQVHSQAGDAPEKPKPLAQAPLPFRWGLRGSQGSRKGTKLMVPTRHTNLEAVRLHHLFSAKAKVCSSGLNREAGNRGTQSGTGTVGVLATQAGAAWQQGNEEHSFNEVTGDPGR